MTVERLLTKLVSLNSLAIVQEQNTASNLNWNIAMRTGINSTNQCIHGQHIEASVATVQDQPRVSNPISPPLANAQTCRDDRILSRIRREKKIFNWMLNIDHEIHNTPKKDCANDTLPGNKPPNNFKQSVTKHLTPCPFLKRKGLCVQGSSCDFLYNKLRPSNVT